MTPHALETKAVVTVFVCLCAAQDSITANESEPGGCLWLRGPQLSTGVRETGCCCQPLFLLSLEAYGCFSSLIRAEHQRNSDTQNVFSSGASGGSQSYKILKCWRNLSFIVSFFLRWVTSRFTHDG